MKKPIASTMQLSLFDEPYELTHNEQEDYTQALQETIEDTNVALKSNTNEVKVESEPNPPAKEVEVIPTAEDVAITQEEEAELQESYANDYDMYLDDDFLSSELDAYDEEMRRIEANRKQKQPEVLTEEEQIKKTIRTLKSELKADFISNDPDMTREEIKEEEQELIDYIKQNYDVDGHYIREPTDRMFLSISAREEVLSANKLKDVNLSEKTNDNSLKELLTTIESEEAIRFPNLRSLSKMIINENFDNEGIIKEDLRSEEAMKQFADDIPNALRAVLKDHSEKHDTSNKFSVAGFGNFIKEEDLKLENFLTASKNMTQDERMKVVSEFEPKTAFVKAMMEDIEESVLLSHEDKLEAKSFIATIYDGHGLPKMQVDKYSISEHTPASLENPSIAMTTAVQWGSRRDPELQDKLKNDIDVTTLPQYEEWMYGNNLKELASTVYGDIRERGVAEEMENDRRRKQEFNEKLDSFHPTNEKLKLVWEELKETDEFYDFEKQDAQNFIMDNFNEDGSSKNKAEAMEEAPYQLVQVVMQVEDKYDVPNSSASSDFDVTIEEREQELKENHDFDADKTLEDMLLSFSKDENEAISIQSNQASNTIDEPVQEVQNNPSPSNRF